MEKRTKLNLWFGLQALLTMGALVADVLIGFFWWNTLATAGIGWWLWASLFSDRHIRRVFHFVPYRWWKRIFVGSVAFTVSMLMFLWGNQNGHRDEVLLQASNIEKLEFEVRKKDEAIKEVEREKGSLRDDNDRLRDERDSLARALESNPEDLNETVKNLVEKNKALEARAEEFERNRQRHLAEEEKVRILGYLSEHPKTKVTVGAFLGDMEATIYAKEITEVLTAAGWDAEGVAGFSVTNGEVKTFIEVQGGASRLEQIKILVNAFVKAGIDGRGRYDPEQPEAELKILVGANPAR